MYLIKFKNTLTLETIKNDRNFKKGENIGGRINRRLNNIGKT